MTSAIALAIAKAFGLDVMKRMRPSYRYGVLARVSQVDVNFKKFEAAKRAMEAAKDEWMQSIGDRIDAHDTLGDASEKHAIIKAERVPR